MPRHAQYVPHGVIPAVLLPFNEDFSIDERGFRSHLRQVAATEGLSAITVNAHSTEVASCSTQDRRISWPPSESLVPRTAGQREEEL